MVIVSQDRDKFICADKVECVFINGYEIYATIGDTNYALAEYETIGRAVNVMEDLAERMALYEGTVFYMPLRHQDNK